MSNKKNDHNSPLPPSFGYMPWLIQLHGRMKTTQNFINPSDGCIEERTVPMMKQKICLGVFGEWLLLMEPKSKELTLWSVTFDHKFSLPHLLEPLESLGGFILSSPPTSSKCNVFFVSKGEMFILHCRPKDDKWKKVQVKFDNIVNHCFRGDITICKGKLYALLSPTRYNLNMLSTIVIDVEALLTGVFENTTIRNPSHPATYVKKFAITSHLVVSSDDVYLVSVYLCSGSIINIGMYILGTTERYTKLKGAELCWSSVSEIGHRTFFLSSFNCASLSANHMQGSYIYLLLHKDGMRLYKISLDNEIASLILPIPEQTDRYNQLYWVVLSRSRSNKFWNLRLPHSICSNEINAAAIYKTKENTSDVSRSWADMPIELLDLLCSRLNLVQFMRLRSVCKAWSSLPLHSMHNKNTWPLLMHYAKHSTTCRFYDPLYGHIYSCEIKELESCEKIWSSNNGWILMTKSDQSACILNPFTGVVVTLPRNGQFCFKNCNSVTISSNREVIAISHLSYDYQVNIYFWQPGMFSWIMDSIRVPNYARNNPIFLNEKLYCLDVDGCLRIFDIRDKSMKIVLDRPEFEFEDCYLLENQGKFFSVYQEGEAKQIYIYSLDETEHVWTKLDDIRDITIFLHRRGSFAMSSSQERFANRIYLPRFDVVESERQKRWIYYSMENREYHPKINDFKEPLDCVWIVPSLNV